MVKIAIIGEAWGEHEEAARAPFVGPSGQELNRMLADAGLERKDCHATNVFNFHPERNDLKTLCAGKRDGGVLGELPPLISGKYLRAEYKGEIDRLLSELEQVRPNLAILCGNTPCWALLHRTGVSKIRGTACVSSVLPWLKCLPVYHPAAVLRQYELRHVTVLDFIKAKREAEFPELRKLERTITLYPTLDDIRAFARLVEQRAGSPQLRGQRRVPLAFDIETAGGQITCISFALSRAEAIVIPFVDIRRVRGNYWSTLEEEIEAWDLVAQILDSPLPKLGQNGLYDISYLWKVYGIPVRNYDEDTMLMHHSLQPESPKGLGFLGSVYTNEPAWKADRIRGKETLKREDDQ